MGVTAEGRGYEGGWDGRIDGGQRSRNEGAVAGDVGLGGRAGRRRRRGSDRAGLRLGPQTRGRVRGPRRSGRQPGPRSVPDVRRAPGGRAGCARVES